MIVEFELPGIDGDVTVAVSLEPDVYLDRFPNWTALACWFVFDSALEYPCNARVDDDGRLMSGHHGRWSATPEQARRIRELAAEYRMSAALSEACAFGAEVMGL